jgi:lysophospholipase
MKQKVEPYLKKRLKVYEICRKENQTIYCESYRSDNPRGIVVISHGFTEFCNRYREVIYYFLEAGYHVYMPEHQGHGRSFRPYLNNANPDYSLTHIDNFNEYVDDLHFVISSLILPIKGNLPLYLYAHSMGGCIATLYLEQHPTIFKKAVLNAPMLEINFGSVPSTIAYGLSKTMCSIGQSHHYALGQLPFNQTPNFKNSGNTSYSRYQYVFSQALSDEKFQNSGASYGWLYEGLKATKKALSPEACQKIKLPILLFSAGNDTFVKTRGQLQFLEQVGHGTFVFVKNAKHEIFLSETPVLEKYWGMIFDFLER